MKRTRRPLPPKRRTFRGIRPTRSRVGAVPNGRTGTQKTAPKRALGQAIPRTPPYHSKTEGPFRSQVGQDRYMFDTYVRSLSKKGVFVEVGAFDGEALSNSFFFEKHLGWRGICVEPHPVHFKTLRRKRNCICVKAAAFDVPKTVVFRMSTENKMLSGVDGHHNTRSRLRGKITSIKVPTVRVGDLLSRHGFETVDYLSVDTEGSELMVLKGIDWNRTHINVVNLEHNYQVRAFSKIKAFLLARGFRIDRFLAHDVFFRNNRLAWSWEEGRRTG